MSCKSSLYGTKNVIFRSKVRLPLLKTEFFKNLDFKNDDSCVKYSRFQEKKIDYLQIYVILPKYQDIWY